MAPPMYGQSVYGGPGGDLVNMRRPANIMSPAPQVVAQDPGMMHPWAGLNKGKWTADA